MNAKATTSARPELVQFRVDRAVASALTALAKKDGRSRSNLLAKIATDIVSGASSSVHSDINRIHAHPKAVK